MHDIMDIFWFIGLITIIPLYMGLVAKVVSFGWYRGKRKAEWHHKFYDKLDNNDS